MPRPSRRRRVRAGLQRVYLRIYKRVLDVGLSLVSVVLLSPAFLITALIVRCSLGSPVLFRQRRPGINGREFTILKFRTMTTGGGVDDANRLTRRGRWLRALSFDELPE